jgi:YD repeat-containing protein
VTCYDDRGRAVSTTDPLLAASGEKATFAYDDLGRVTSIDGRTDVALTWGAGTTLARVVDGATTTSMSSYGGRIVTKEIKTGALTDRLRYSYATPQSNAPIMLLDDSGIAAVEYALPGGARVRAGAGEVPTIALTGIDGSALAVVDLPVAAVAGVSGGALSGRAGVPERFGPYGEVLTARPALLDAAPCYTWQAAQRHETLGGEAAIVEVDRVFGLHLGQRVRAVAGDARPAPSHDGFAARLHQFEAVARPQAQPCRQRGQARDSGGHTAFGGSQHEPGLGREIDPLLRLQHQAVAVCQSPHGGQVGLKAAREQQHPLPPQPAGQGLLQQGMHRPAAAYQPGSSGAHPLAGRGGLGGGHHRWVRAEAEVVVAGQIEQLGRQAAQLAPGAGGLAGQLPGQGALPGGQVTGGFRLELGCSAAHGLEARAPNLLGPPDRLLLLI